MGVWSQKTLHPKTQHGASQKKTIPKPVSPTTKTTTKTRSPRIIVHFARHAQAQNNLPHLDADPDPPLTPKGTLQCATLRQKFKIYIQHIFYVRRYNGDGGGFWGGSGGVGEGRGDGWGEEEGKGGEENLGVGRGDEGEGEGELAQCPNHHIDAFEDEQGIRVSRAAG
ncbi:hypothetical protein SBOR_6915 [Sclerotinia borealis F-4128]|uniref:Phosphoglycerate mutase family protein n=1 Tax=Sclerotinia borealis (strain F-4128) TaxID=1432307 RepID=W9CA77_SCLBF|nr:hypothetical protein SBOR_6915 [Sclerotinia borealis F-4128]